MVLDESVRAFLSSLRLDFSRIVMLGASGKLFSSYDLRHSVVEQNVL